MAMAMWDKIVSRTFYLPINVHEQLNQDKKAFYRDLDSMIDAARDAAKVDIQNVVDYLYEHTDDYDKALSQVSGAIPPWPNCWLEGTATFAGDHSIQFGVLVAAGDRDAWSDTKVHVPEGHQCLVSVLWVTMEQYPNPHGPVFMAKCLVDSMGRIKPVTDPEGQQRYDMSHLQLDAQEIEHSLQVYEERGMPDGRDLQRAIRDQSSVYYMLAVDFPLFTFQFANCRNVEIEDVEPSRQVRRWHERRGIEPPKHHVLVLDPHAITKRRPAGEKNPIPLSKRLHIVKGHFAYYGEEYGRGKMFGKYEGQFWITPHMRGSDALGKSDASYKVLAP